MTRRANKLFYTLSGYNYLAIVLDADQSGLQPEKLFKIGKIRLVTHQRTVDKWSDYAAMMVRDNLDDLASWQFDYTILFERTRAGRDMLAKHGPLIDKMRNGDHPAWGLARHGVYRS
jgi:hypothetical protein